jgi:hypothetical protein
MNTKFYAKKRGMELLMNNLKAAPHAAPSGCPADKHIFLVGCLRKPSFLSGSADQSCKTIFSKPALDFF